jgi:uncharacterized protein (TIGR02246 family)
LRVVAVFRFFSTTGCTTMKRTKWTISLSCIMLVSGSGDLVPGARAQVPVPVRSQSAPVAAASLPGAPSVASASPVSAHRVEDQHAIGQITEMFVRAFNAGDANAVASLYTDDAELIDEYGERIDGRAAIQNFYAALFGERKGATIEIAVASLRFLGPDVAKETGQTRVDPKGSEPITHRDYTVIYVKQNGRWLHSSVREEFPSSLTHHERLKELEWTLGDWIDENSESVIHATCRWSDDKNFLLREFEIQVHGKPMMKVTERIGWDPLTEQIKSWFFDSDGGYGHAYWTRGGNQWRIKSTGVLADGRIATATNLLTRINANAARWHSTERTVGREVAPDHPESVMVRRPPPPQTQPRPN